MESGKCDGLYEKLLSKKASNPKVQGERELCIFQRLK